MRNYSLFPVSDLRPLLSAKEIAAQCGDGLTARAVLRWAKLGKIPFIKINQRVIRFDPVEVRKKLRQGSI